MAYDISELRKENSELELKLEQAKERIKGLEIAIDIIEYRLKEALRNVSL